VTGRTSYLGTDAREPIIRVSGLHKSFGSLLVLHDLSFDVHDGEILGVVGPSGGGKTSLLRCLNALEAFESGEILYLGDVQVRVGPERDTTFIRETVAGSDGDDGVLSTLRRRVGMVFQGFNLWEERTLLDNLTLAPIVVCHEPRDSAIARALALCEQFGIADKLRGRAWSLSGGQRQRAAIVRALMMQPRVLLLDEITSALDPVLTVEVMNAIRQLRDRGLTLVVVTHHLDFATALCDRLMFLSDGAIVQLDAPSTLLDKPATEEVARFLDILRRAR